VCSRKYFNLQIVVRRHVYQHQVIHLFISKKKLSQKICKAAVFTVTETEGLVKQQLVISAGLFLILRHHRQLSVNLQ